MFTFVKKYGTINKKSCGVKNLELSVHKIAYTDSKSLSVELNFAFACDRVAGKELAVLIPEDEASVKKFVSAAERQLKNMKRIGDIQLYIFETELDEADKREVVYLLNRFPELAGVEERRAGVIIVKL